MTLSQAIKRSVKKDKKKEVHQSVLMSQIETDQSVTMIKNTDKMSVEDENNQVYDSPERRQEPKTLVTPRAEKLQLSQEQPMSLRTPTLDLHKS